jgi:hypothetical protein
VWWEGFVENQAKSWFAILSFCATVATVAAFALAILVASATIALALANRVESPGSGNEVTVIKAEASLPVAKAQSGPSIGLDSIAEVKTHHPRRVR